MNPEKVALVLIDIQRDFWAPIKEENRFPEFPEKVSRLLDISRKQGFHVIHIRSVFQPDRSDWMLFYRPEGRGTIPCIAGTEGAEFVDFSQPKRGEKIIEKQTFDAFVDTGLDDYLRSLGVNTVLLAGLETSVCVLFSATSAYLRKYLPLVVSDACADTVERHGSMLRMYGDLCFKEITTEQLENDAQSVEKLVETFALKPSR
ncbi:cysteine hydrolase [Candidatus Bathyarchaeota archaeon]|nr:cysteine hydrolase [Candidatus Bathyarchaeota archaeon]